MKKSALSRCLAALLCASLLAPAGGANAQSGTPWPEPRPVFAPPVHQAQPRNLPNFQAPSAPHCARPVSLREIPGPADWGQQHSGRWGGEPAREARDAAALSDRSRRGAPGAPAAAAPELPAPPPPPMAAAAPTGVPTPPPPPPPMPSSPPRAPSARIHPQLQAPADGVPQQSPGAHGPVTAGVVDDNADFTSYLAFRQRTQVEHRRRDIRDRYLLEVKDARGRGIVDAEVAVQGTSGFATWARTDAAGRAWLHPDAFDPARSHAYEVIARKDGRMAWARLARGQKSAVEVVLDAPAAAPRARLDLVFMIDATGSMADEIDKLKATLRTITAEVANLPSRPDICLALVAYRDRGDDFLVRSHDFTDDVGGFLQHALYPLQAAGGGDYPESMNEALHETVHELSWRGEGTTRMVILLADAPPHLDYGAPWYDDDMLAALGKGIKIFGVGASGLDRQGEFIQRQMAQYTGGKFVFLTYADAHRPGSGPGRETLHDVRNYSVDTLDRLIVRLVREELAKQNPRGG